MDLHIYKKGYSTLPNLKKINLGEVFEKNKSDSNLIKIEKEDSIRNQVYFKEYNNPPHFYKICEEFLKENYPTSISGNNYLEIAKEIDEDLIIHRIDQEKDYTSSVHVCFPSQWLPEEKVGKSFEEVHAPVPMNLINSKKLVGAIINGGAFERFVWSVVYEKKYNFHPRFKFKYFDTKNPQVYVKVERQVTVGFPKENFCLFILRQYIIEEKNLDKNLLAKSIENMTKEQKHYKSLNNSNDLINYLKAS